MGTPYLNIYSRFLDKVTDYFIFDLSDEDACNHCYRLMLSAISIAKPFIHSFDLDDENYCFVEELDNVEIEYIGSLMTAEWVSPQLNNTILTKQYIGTKDEKFFAQANQINQLRELRNDNIARSKKIRRDYLYSNSELG